MEREPLPAGSTVVWIVERYWPGVTEAAFAAAADRLHASTATLCEQGRTIRYLGSAFLPADEAVLCLFEAGCADDVAEANRDAQVPVDRISPALAIGLSTRS